MAKFIYALGIRNVGEKTAQDLAEKFGSLEKIQKTKLDELENIKDIGPIVAKSVYNWFCQKSNIKFLEKIKRVGIKIKSYLVVRPGILSDDRAKLKGKTFVLTGALESMAREEAKEKIRELGGDVSESVSKNTDFLVIGKEPGSKYDKAKELGIKIMNEQKFLQLI